MFHQRTSSLGWYGDINFVIMGYGTQNEFSLPYSHLNGSHKWLKIFQQSDSQLFCEQHTLLMVVIPQNKPEII